MDHGQLVLRTLTQKERKQYKMKQSSVQDDSGDAYAASGVDINLGDAFSAYCGNLCRQSWNNSRFVRVHDLAGNKHFRGPRGFEFIDLPQGSILTAGADGVGTKHVVIDAAKQHPTTANNLLAMCAGDITRYGGIPLVFMNILDIESFGTSGIYGNRYLAAQSLMDGLAQRAREQGYVLLGGETAELPGCVTSENTLATLNCLWGGFMIGAYHPDKMILGDKMKPGDRIIALKDVCRSNGISLLRKYLSQSVAKNYWYCPDNEFVQEVAAPAALYEKFLVAVHGWTGKGYVPFIEMKGISNISGGGILGKFGDLIFQHGLSAHLDNLWDPPNVMKSCAKDMKLNDPTCYSTWCCGNGTLVVISEEEVGLFLELAPKFDIDARNAGIIEETPNGRIPSITIKSGFTGNTFSHFHK
jgi:phosphoribosylformylglycinamidine cyclo-ligase